MIDDVRTEALEADAPVERVIDILIGWIDEDRKATPLKALQGKIWRHGYENGDFTGHIYDDAVEGLRRWAAGGVDLYVYSSGSVGAQQLLFAHSDAGDLRPLFKGYFDTRVGHKKETASYESIAAQIDLPAGNILFLSDVAEELDAARQAEMPTYQLVRDELVVTGSHPVARNFDEVIINGYDELPAGGAE
jgi:enolase-phosphatase E1